MIGRIGWIIAGMVTIGLIAGVGFRPVPYALGGGLQMKVTAKEFAFTPKAIAVPTGTVQFVVSNTGAIEHSFVIDALKIKTLIKPGQSVTLTATIKPGVYQVYCDVPGHKEIGMVATVTAK